LRLPDAGKTFFLKFNSAASKCSLPDRRGLFVEILKIQAIRFLHFAAAVFA
jgi:hypothetical protein